MSLRFEGAERGDAVFPPGVRSLVGAGIEVDMLSDVHSEGHTELSLTIPAADLPQAEALLAELIGSDGYRFDSEIALVTVTGFDPRQSAPLAANLFVAFESEGIDVQQRDASLSRFAYVVPAAQAEHAVEVARVCLEIT